MSTESEYQPWPSQRMDPHPNAAHTSSQADQQRPQASPLGANGCHGLGARRIEPGADGSLPTLDFTYNEAVPGFEESASDCLNRALHIALSLNHTSLSSDHLMLALTMDH